DAPGPQARAAMEALFRGVPYQLVFHPDMDAWYKCHIVWILPVAYVCYEADCDLTKAPRAQLRQALDAAREGYGLLAAQGCPILPEGTEDFFRPGSKRTYLSVLFWIMARTSLGRLAASDHCRNAVAEMEALDSGFASLRAQTPDFPMPSWDALRERMPDWETLRMRFGGAVGQEGRLTNS
nr:hypothetical protein [Clostridia bacterium]